MTAGGRTSTHHSAPMDLPTPFRWHGEHIAASLPGGEVLFSTRRGGVSEGPSRR